LGNSSLGLCHKIEHCSKHPELPHSIITGSLQFLVRLSAARHGKRWTSQLPDQITAAMAVEVEVTTTPTFQVGTPKPLFKTNAVLPYWEVTPDGQQFLAPVAVGANAAAPYTVLLNWQAELKK
jgi:hypothetical protein